MCGFLNADADERDLAPLADTDAPLLVLVDYAETRTEQLRRLLRCSGTPTPVTRCGCCCWPAPPGSGGPGWRGNSTASLGKSSRWGRWTRSRIVPRSSRAAVAAFAERLDDAAPGDATAACHAGGTAPRSRRRPVRLPADAAAGRAHRACCKPDSPDRAAAGGAQAEDTLLRHEERYWIDTAHSAGLDLSATVLRRVVAAATLCGASSFDDAGALAGAVPGTGDLTQDRLHRLDSWLSGLYPPDTGQRWGSLQPDRLGEYLIATTLPDDTRPARRVARRNRRRSASSRTDHPGPRPGQPGPDRARERPRCRRRCATLSPAILPAWVRSPCR